MSMSRIISEIDSLYDKVKGDNDDFIDEESFEIKVNEMIDTGFMEKSIFEDTLLYSARHHLRWADFVDIDDPIKKTILLLLVENPTTFFVLLNTQKGKMRINSLEIKTWSECATKRVVAFIVVDNDTTLADQSAEGIKNVFGVLNVNLIMLSSTAKTTYSDLQKTIDAYEFNPDEYNMPVIVLLANNKQVEKMIMLINHIDSKIKNRQSLLRYGIVWDEADKIYPQFRDKTFNISGQTLSIKDFIIYNNIGLYRLGFTTASEGQLLEEDYPECANAYLYPVVIDPEDKEYYRALHHPQAKTHRVPCLGKTTNNSYAMNILNSPENINHFNTPITLPSGEIYYRKIIVNSNSKTKDMVDFAKSCNEKNMYAFVFNGYCGTSVKVYRPGMPVKNYKTRGKKFNEVLFYIYKKLHLNDKPLVIIGRRKVDRGLGFHYCPRKNDEITIDYRFEEGSLITSNKEGLIWTDMILGRIEDKDVAVQKAGRLAGIIGNSPQYSGSIHYWTDEHTEALIRRHNTIVDKANEYTGCSILQAVSHARDTIPIKKINHRVSVNKFVVYRDESIVKNVCLELEYSFRRCPINSDGFKHTSLNGCANKQSLLDAIKSVPDGYGCQKQDVDGEDVSQRPLTFIKISSGEKKGKFGKVVSKLENNKYNVSIDTEILQIDRKEFMLVQYRTYYPCYKDLEDPTSLHYVIIIRPGDESKLEGEDGIKKKFPSIDIPQEGDF
jgi:hypothetical protein